MMMELTGQARLFALPMLVAIVVANDRNAVDLRGAADR